MSLDEEDIRLLEARFEAILDRKLAAIMAPLLRTAPDPIALPRLTVEQFAIATGMHPNTVRKKIRAHEIDRRLVYGSCPKYISPAALDRYGVTPREALTRLEAQKQAPALLQSAA